MYAANELRPGMLTNFGSNRFDVLLFHLLWADLLIVWSKRIFDIHKCNHLPLHKCIRHRNFPESGNSTFRQLALILCRTEMHITTTQFSRWAQWILHCRCGTKTSSNTRCCVVPENPFSIQPFRMDSQWCSTTYTSVYSNCCLRCVLWPCVAHLFVTVIEERILFIDVCLCHICHI